MRKNRFRVWSKKYEIMYYDDEFFIDGNGDIYFCINNYDGIQIEKSNRENFVIMESTGIKDELGFYIYEEDIVAYTDKNNNTNKLTVRYNENTCSFNLSKVCDFKLKVVFNNYEK